jgi:transposase
MLYKLRARVEQTVGKLKRFKRTALRCEKTTASFTALASFACSIMIINSVHIAWSGVDPSRVFGA